MDNRNNSILVVSFWYENAIGTASVRSSRLSVAFTNRFQKVHVLTNKLDNTVDKIEVHNVQVKSFVERLKQLKGAPKLVKEKSKKKGWFKYSIKLFKSFPTNLIFADANIRYINKAIRMASEIVERENVTTIFSSMLPYGDHYICYRLKAKYPYLNWIADYRDLHIEPLYQDVYMPGIQRWMEHKVLAKANIVTAVSQGVSDHLIQYNRPVFSIMRGMEKRDPKDHYSQFTISYTGSLFQDFRDPRPVFKVIRDEIQSGRLDGTSLSIVYAGKDSELFSQWVKDYNLSHIYSNKGLISRIEAQDIQDRSHINLLLTSSTREWQGVLTGKVFEYIESGNATLCLINGVKDPEFEALFQELNAGKVVYHPELESGAMMNFLIEKYNEWKATGKVEKRVNFDKVKAEHSWQSRVDFMLSKLKEPKVEYNRL